MASRRTGIKSPDSINIFYSFFKLGRLAFLLGVLADSLCGKSVEKLLWLDSYLATAPHRREVHDVQELQVRAAKAPAAVLDLFCLEPEMDDSGGFQRGVLKNNP